jgi:hypothetical protein
MLLSNPELNSILRRIVLDLSIVGFESNCSKYSYIKLWRPLKIYMVPGSFNVRPPTPRNPKAFSIHADRFKYRRLLFFSKPNLFFEAAHLDPWFLKNAGSPVEALFAAIMSLNMDNSIRSYGRIDLREQYHWVIKI